MNSSVFLPFDDVLDDLTRNGKKIKKEDYLVEGIYPIIDQGAGQIAGYSNESDGLYQDVPALIFGDHTRIIKYVDTPFFLGADGVKLLRSKISEINYRYLYYFLIANPVKNTGYNRHYKWLKELLIPVRSVEEQCKIVDMLDILTDMLRLRTQQLADLDLLIKSRFVEMFGNVKNQMKLKDVATFINGDRGKNYPSGSDFVASGIPFINAGHLEKDSISFEAMNFITEEKYHKLSQGKIKKNDILYCLRGSLGKMGIVDFDQGAIASSLVIIRAIKEKISPLFLLNALKTNSIKCQQVVANTGSSQPNLSAQSVKNYLIEVPEVARQLDFVRFVEQTDKSKFAIQQSITELTTLKQALMQKYFGPQQTSAT